MMARFTSEDRQRLIEQLENLQIELGCLLQMVAKILEWVHVVSAQLNTPTDILESGGGHRAPSED